MAEVQTRSAGRGAPRGRLLRTPWQLALPAAPPSCSAARGSVSSASATPIASRAAARSPSHAKSRTTSAPTWLPASTPASAPSARARAPLGAMRYLCLIYDDEKKWQGLSQKEQEAGIAEYGAFTESVKKNGHWIAAERLQPVQTATTVRIRNGKLSTTDGPYAETKERLGGFYLINAKDLNDALQVASRIPSAKW